MKIDRLVEELRFYGRTHTPFHREGSPISSVQAISKAADLLEQILAGAKETEDARDFVVWILDDCPGEPIKKN